MIFSTGLTKIKNLLADKSRYGFDDSDDYETAINTANEMAVLKNMYEVISSSTYSDLESTDDNSLTSYQKYLGYAEVTFSIAEFLTQRGQIKRNESEGTSSTYSQAGVTVNYGSEQLLLKSANDFIKQAHEYLRLAGYTRQTTINKSGLTSEWVYSGYENIY